MNRDRLASQAEFDEYTRKAQSRLEDGLPPLGAKNAVQELSLAPLEVPKMRICPKSQVEESHKVGGVRISSQSSSTPYYVLFRDDGDVAYFFAFANLGPPHLMDALQIYNTGDILDRDKTHLFEIVWTEDGLRAALLINKKPYAVFDFVQYRGYSRTNFPPSNPESSFGEYSHEWSDECMKPFFDEMHMG